MTAIITPQNATAKARQVAFPSMPVKGLRKWGALNLIDFTP